MKQVVQNIQNGKQTVESAPDPVPRPGQVLIANAASVISAGTEKMVVELAGKSLLGKARERPDHVRRVLEKVRNEGLLSTVAQVRAKLDEPMPLGYSSSGVVLACGRGVEEFKPGDRVASNGPHASIVCVPRHLCARIPDGVPDEQAAFAVIAAIALQGVRLARVGLGDTVFVVGLGLIGQITAALLRSAGCRVLGTDLDGSKCELGRRMGCEEAAVGLGASRVAELTGGLGADAVLVTASTDSSAPVELAAEAVRKRGRIVAVGAVGMTLPRPPLYLKEAEFVVSCSYGPGRYDADYEDRGRDYPAAYVRWTEQRNIQAVLDQMGAGRLDLAPLISHRYPVEEAEQAYALISGGDEPYLGVVLSYPETDPEQPRRSIVLGVGRRGEVGLAVIGAGNFARMVMLPALRQERRFRPRVLCTAGGMSALHGGRKFGFEIATSDVEMVLGDPSVDAVFVLTRHDDHAELVVRAIEAGKHVFVEKPLALTEDELAAVERALAGRGPDAPLLMVGFNRRFAPTAVAAREHLAQTGAPLTVMYRFNAGAIPADHWTQDADVGGGRIIGEACHAIDLATFLCGSPPTRVFGESVGGEAAPSITDDQAFITLRHANGSTSCVAYLAGGDKAFPKERIEVFGGGRICVIDDFRALTRVAGGRSKRQSSRQDKGHQAEVVAFADALTGAGPVPIPWDQLRAVSLASIRAVDSLREGLPLGVDR